MGPKKKGGDAEKGGKVFKAQCAICHSLTANGTGPKLGGLFGREAGGADGFGYSGVFKEKMGGQKWTDKNLDKWLKSPADLIPGNSMAFAGVPNAKDRADLIAYLKENAK